MEPETQPNIENNSGTGLTAAPSPDTPKAVPPQPATPRLLELILPLYMPMFLLMFGYGVVMPVIPLFARQLGAGLGLTGFVVSLRGIGTLILDIPTGRRTYLEKQASLGRRALPASG